MDKEQDTPQGHIDIKRAVSDNRSVEFLHYTQGNLYYQTEFGEVFPVPIEDCGEAYFNKIDKAILFMRYMRKFNKSIA